MRAVLPTGTRVSCPVVVASHAADSGRAEGGLASDAQAGGQNGVVDLQVAPVTAAHWPDVVTVLGGSRSKPDSCWCQRFCVHDEPDNHSALRKEIKTADVAVGLVAYADGEPVGWSRVVPRKTLPGVEGNRAIQRLVAEDEIGWWVTCCVVRREHRGRGVGVALLAGAVEHARRQGASVLDGHPVDVSRLKARPSPSALFTGTFSTFRKAGFSEIGRTYPSRPVMRHLLG